MADNNVVFKVKADFDNAIKEWEQLRDKVADTTREFEDAQKEIEKLKIAKGEFTGEIYKTKAQLKAESDELKKSNLEYKKREKELNRVFKVQEKNTKSIKGLTKKQIQQKDATGSATSATMELSRVISDAPYGIRGMANNITQLVSQLGTASTKAGGLTGALKLMGKQLMGPLGVVFAITVVVSALDYFFGAQKKVEKATKKTTKEISKQVTALQKLNNISNAIKGLLFTDSDTEALDKYNKGLLTTEETVKIVTRNFNDFSNAYNKLTDEQKKDGKNVKSLLNGYQEMLSLREKEKVQIKSLRDLRVIVDKQDKDAEERKKKGYKDALSTISNEKTQLKSLESEYISTQKRLIKLEGFFAKEKDEKTKRTSSKIKKFSPFKTKEELEIDVKDNEKALLDLSRKIKIQELKNQEATELLGAKNADEKFQIKKKYAERLLEIQLTSEKKQLILRKSIERAVMQQKFENFQKEAMLRLEAYKDKVRLSDLDDGKKESLVSNATSGTTSLITKSKEELDISFEELDKKYEPINELFENLAILRRKALGISIGKDGEGTKDEELGSLEDYLNTYKELMGGVSDFISAEYDRQMAIEQNKTNALNEELNNRLLNENLSKEERARIQNQIGQNDEKLRKKQEAIARKQFNTAKAFNIGMATVETYLAAQKAYTSQLVVGDPTSPIRAKIAAGVAVASGLAKVAAIARTKFQSTSASTPVNIGGGGSGSGEGVGDREFNFNLVGNTQNNQLLETLQSQFERPLQAFVVSKDITTQQELDANIRGGASI